MGPFFILTMTSTKITLILLALLHSSLALFIHSKDGTQLWAEAKGNPSNPHLVWIHGYLLSSLVFNKHFEDEAYLSNFYMVRYDMRGLGRSDKPLDPASYESKKFADDFDAVVQAFNLHKPFVAGWSYGGSIGADIYAYHGHGYISGYIYFASFYGMGTTRQFTRPIAVDFFPKIFQDSNVTMYHESENKFIDSLVADPSLLSFETRMLWFSLAGLIPQPVKRILLLREQDTTRLFDEGGPSLPVLYVEGSKDAILDNAGVVELFRPRFKKLEVLTLPNAGHMVFLDEYEEVRERMLQFVSNVVSDERQERDLPPRSEL